MVQITAIFKSSGKTVKLAIRRALGAAQNVTRQSVASGGKVKTYSSNARTYDSYSSCSSL